MQNQGNMEDRVRNLEILMDLSASLTRDMAEHQQRMENSRRRMEENHRRMAENQLQISENLRRIFETLEIIQEEHQYLEESGRRRDELIQQMLQAVAVMQADIVRIDETHS